MTEFEKIVNQNSAYTVVRFLVNAKSSITKEEYDFIVNYHAEYADDFTKISNDKYENILKTSEQGLGEATQSSYIHGMNKAKIQSIINTVYPKIKADYGLAKVYGCPKVEIHRNIYEMASNIEGMEGEDNAQANFCRHSNTIQLFQTEIKDTKHVIQCLLHEYKHYLQSATWFKRYYQIGYDYTNHPYELEAIAEEKNWKKYAKLLGEATQSSYIHV